MAFCVKTGVHRNTIIAFFYTFQHFQVGESNCMRYQFFWNVMLRQWIFGFRRFETTTHHKPEEQMTRAHHCENLETRKSQHVFQNVG